MSNAEDRKAEREKQQKKSQWSQALDEYFQELKSWVDESLNRNNVVTEIDEFPQPIGGSFKPVLTLRISVRDTMKILDFFDFGIDYIAFKLRTSIGSDVIIVRKSSGWFFKDNGEVTKEEFIKFVKEQLGL